jgi:hypothetical protein
MTTRGNGKGEQCVWLRKPLRRELSFVPQDMLRSAQHDSEVKRQRATLSTSEKRFARGIFGFHPQNDGDDFPKPPD